ncbi:MAG: hypothetical protein ACRD88_14110 [Terriglobia bacterium]
MRPIHITRSRIRSILFRLGLSSLGIALFACILGIRSAAAQDDWAFRPPTSTGPAVGQRIPPFRGPDQNGRTQDFNSIRGPKGAAIYFMRSADW